jgi:hypothetical protein
VLVWELTWGVVAGFSNSEFGAKIFSYQMLSIWTSNLIETTVELFYIVYLYLDFAYAQGKTRLLNGLCGRGSRATFLKH